MPSSSNSRAQQLLDQLNKSGDALIGALQDPKKGRLRTVFGFVVNGRRLAHASRQLGEELGVAVPTTVTMDTLKLLADKAEQNKLEGADRMLRFVAWNKEFWPGAELAWHLEANPYKSIPIIKSLAQKVPKP